MEGQHQFPHCCGIQGVQLLSPSRFSFSRSFPCHSATDKDGCLSSNPRAASISGESSAGRTGNAETTQATCTPFFRKTGDSDMFLIITDTLLLLILSLVYVCRTCNPRGSGHAPPGLSGPSPQRHHHHLGTLPNERFNPALHDLVSEQPELHILLCVNWLIYILTHWELGCCGPMFYGAISDHSLVFRCSAPLAQQAGCSHHLH